MENNKANLTQAIHALCDTVNDICDVTGTPRGTPLSEIVSAVINLKNSHVVEKDTIRLANVTIEQHEATIRALREGDKYSGEDISRIIAEAQQDGYHSGKADGIKQAQAETMQELRKAGIKHGTYQDSNGMEVWHYGARRVVMGALGLMKCDDPMQGRRNDELLNEAFIGSGKLQSAEIVGEVAQFTANTTGYITVTRVGNEVTTTAEIEGPAVDVRQTLVDIAYALGNGPTPAEIENSDVSVSCDPTFGVNVGEVLANSQARGR